MAPNDTQPSVETILSDVAGNLKDVREIGKKDVNFFEKELARPFPEKPTNAQIYDRDRARKAVASGRKIVELADEYEAGAGQLADSWLNDELSDAEFCESLTKLAGDTLRKLIGASRKSHRAPFQMTVMTSTRVLVGMVGGLKAAHALTF